MLISRNLLLGIGMSVALSPSAIRAGELAEIMPQDTVLYLEWSGADAVRDAYTQTALGKLMAEPEVQRFVAELDRGVKRLMVAPQAGSVLKQVGMGLQMARPLLQHLWHHRAAFSLIGTELVDTGPSVTAALAIQLSGEQEGAAAAVQGLVNMLTMQVPKQAETIGEFTFQRIDYSFFPPIRFGVVGDVFLVTVGSEVPKDILAVRSGGDAGLSSNQRYLAARKKLGSTAANTTFVAHLDLVRFREQARRFLLGHTGSEEFPPPIGALLEELGVNRINSMTYTGQFADGGCRDGVFVAVDGTSRGAGKLFAAKPLTDEDFFAIPADATLAKAANFELAAVFEEAMRIAGVFAPDVVAQLDERFEHYTGLKLREEVIGLFDDGWAVFHAPSQGGLWLGGLTLVVETKDGPAFAAMLEKLVERLRAAVGDNRLSLKKTEHHGRSVYVSTISAAPVPVAPAWGAHENRVVIALFPQMVVQTLDRLAAADVESRCILSNPDFARARGLMPPHSSSIAYNDTRRGMSEVYPFVLPLVTAGCSFAAANGISLDVSTIPTQETVCRHLFGDISSVSRDEDGIMFTRHGPLPLPILSVGLGGGAATTAVLAAIALPSLGRARELSKRKVSEANLEGIGLACRVYALEHDDTFPPDLEALVAGGQLARAQLISPRDSTLSSATASRGDCSYVYIAGQSTKSDPRNVLAYEPDYDGEGGNVLFIDGHVDWLKPPRYLEVINDTHRRLGRTPPSP